MKLNTAINCTFSTQIDFNIKIFAIIISPETPTPFHYIMELVDHQLLY